MRNQAVQVNAKARNMKMGRVSLKKKKALVTTKGMNRILMVKIYRDITNT